jgi:hypothetical protein
VWVAHLLGTEESARLYAYPRSDEQMAEAAELGAIRDHVCAEYLAKTGGDADGAVWQSAFAKWEQSNA